MFSYVYCSDLNSKNALMKNGLENPRVIGSNPILPICVPRHNTEICDRVSYSWLCCDCTPCESQQWHGNSSYPIMPLTECGSVWKSTCFGNKGSGVQISPLRASVYWRSQRTDGKHMCKACICLKVIHHAVEKMPLVGATKPNRM